MRPDVCCWVLKWYESWERPTWADLRRRSFLPQLARCDELVRYIAIVFVQIKRLFNLTGPFSSYPSPLVWFLFELNLRISSKALLMWTYCTGRAGLGGGFIRMANLPPVLHQSTCSQWLSTVSQLTLITAYGSKPCMKGKTSGRSTASHSTLRHCLLPSNLHSTTHLINIILFCLIKTAPTDITPRAHCVWLVHSRTEVCCICYTGRAKYFIVKMLCFVLYWRNSLPRTKKK